MKVITLERITDFITAKHGAQVVTRTKIAGADKNNGVTIIHDAGTPCIGAFMNAEGELEFSGDHDGIHCILLESDMNDYYKMYPFIKSREALSGVLVIDGETPSEDELSSYMYKL